MKYLLSTLAGLLAFVVWTSTAFAAAEGKAGVLLPLAIYYDAYTTNDGSVKTTTTIWNLDLNAGYRFNKGLYLGGQYFMGSKDVANSPGSDTTNVLTWYGPEIGYFDKGWSIRLGYAFNGQIKQASPTSQSYDSGSGFFGEVGYEFMLGEHVGIGPMLKYYDVTFTKFTNSAGTQTTLTKNYEAYGLDPYVMVVVHF